MRLAKVSINNFRCFSGFEIGFEGFTAVIGRNNTGKSSLLHALELLFHSGSDRTIHLYKEDFRQQDLPIVIQAIFTDLDPIDTQAFFSLDGTPGITDVGVRLQANWEEGEVVCDRFLIRPDKPTEEEQKIRRFTQRFSQFITFSYIPPFRQPEQTTRFTRGSDYRALVSTYAGDFIQPIQALLNDIRNLHQRYQAEIEQQGGLNTQEYLTMILNLDKLLIWINNSSIGRGALTLLNGFEEELARLQLGWEHANSKFLSSIDDAVENGENSITQEVRENHQQLTSKVEKLLQRCKIQTALITLRDSVMDNDDFTQMQTSLSVILDLLLPEMPPEVLPFPAQDDRLFNEVLIKLGNIDLLQCGSGYQSTFSIGLRIARILGDVIKGTSTRIVMIGIEEPEVHLHPHKQRHLIKALLQIQQKMEANNGIKLQFFITTHSSNILSGLSHEQVIILRTNQGLSQPTKLERDGFLDSWVDELGIKRSDKRSRAKKIIQRWIHRFFEQYAEILFARFTLLLEGDSEIGAFHEWAKHLNPPNNLDLLGISILSGRGTEFKYASYLMKQFQVENLVVFDRGDGHAVSGLDPASLLPTNYANYEEEILAVIPIKKILRAIEATLTDEDLDDVYKYLTRSNRVPGLSGATDWQDILNLVEGNYLQPEDLDRLKRTLTDHQLGINGRQILKGADVGALIAASSESRKEVPPVYLSALERAQKTAVEIMTYE